MTLHRTAVLTAVLVPFALYGCSEELAEPEYGEVGPEFNHSPKTNTNPTTIQLTGLTWETDAITYRVRVSPQAPQALVDGVNDAISDWAHAISVATGFTFTEAAPGISPDVTIHVKRGGGLVQGQQLTLDPDGDDRADRSIVHVSGSAFGDFSGMEARAKSVTLHELGHSFQLGHADNPEDVMFAEIQDPPVTQLSECDEKAAEAAHENFPDPPTKSSVSCP